MRYAIISLYIIFTLYKKIKNPMIHHSCKTNKQTMQSKNDFCKTEDQESVENTGIIASNARAIKKIKIETCQSIGLFVIFSFPVGRYVSLIYIT